MAVSAAPFVENSVCTCCVLLTAPPVALVNRGFDFGRIYFRAPFFKRLLYTVPRDEL